MVVGVLPVTTELISRHKPGDAIMFTVVKGGQTKRVQATLTERPSAA